MAKKQAKKSTTKKTTKKTKAAKSETHELDSSMPFIFATHNRRVMFLLVGALILMLGLIWVANVNDKYNKENKHQKTYQLDDHSISHSHPHKSDSYYEVNSNKAPFVEIEVEEDKVGGWNVILNTSKFTFTPENINGKNKSGEGHAHLYVDGEKAARIYGEYYHYNQNFDGTVEFKVTLNANDHSQYKVKGGDPVESTISVYHSHD